MKITYLSIRNYKSIEELVIEDVEDVLILVGRNNAGKSIVLDAVRAVFGEYPVNERDFHGNEGNINIFMKLMLTEEDLHYLHGNAAVSNFKHFDLWKKDFCQKLPSYEPETGILSLEYVYGRDGVVRYRDGVHKNNNYIKNVFPKIYFVDHYRNNVDLKEDFMMLQGDKSLQQLKDNRCIFDGTKSCRQCFDCIGVINKKKPEELTLLETSRLMQYKVTERNVLILKYYSFENYFLFPEIMQRIGVVKSVEQFYDILWTKYQEYLYRLSSVKKMQEQCAFKIESRQDLIDHIEEVRIYVRGHNLYDIYYGRYKANENEILSRYIDAAPREIFGDILEKIDAFIYFQSRKCGERK